MNTSELIAELKSLLEKLYDDSQSYAHRVGQAQATVENLIVELEQS